MRYLGQDTPRDIYAESTDGAVHRYRAQKFHQYFAGRDLAVIFSGTIYYSAFGNSESDKTGDNDEKGTDNYETE